MSFQEIIIKHSTIILILICICIIAYVIKETITINKDIFGKKREKYSVTLNYDNKNNPNFYTEFGKIPTEYINYCYSTNNKDGKIMDLRLKDFFVASAFRPYQVAGQTNDICSYEGIKQVLNKGARFHFIDVWSSNSINIYDMNAKPLVRNKTLMPKFGKPLDFEKVCQLYANNAWNGTNYPLILYLNIQDAKDNKYVMQKMTKSLLNNFKGRLVDLKYAFGRDNIGNLSIKDAMNKIIILTNIYPDEEDLQELTNGVISEKTQNSGNLMIMKKDHIEYGGVKAITPDTKTIMEFNKTHLGILIPGDIKSTSNILYPGNDLVQIPAEEPMVKYGFNFVCINYQNPGTERDKYVNFFKKASFVVKPDKLRDVPCPKPIIVKADKRLSYAPNTMDVHKGFFSGKI